MLVTSGTDSFQNETTAGRVIWEWRTREALPRGGHTKKSVKRQGGTFHWELLRLAM